MWPPPASPGKKILAAFTPTSLLQEGHAPDYDRMLRSIAQYEEKRHDPSAAEIEAFYANTRARGWTTAGKPTGFLEYTRREDGRRPAAERVRDWRVPPSPAGDPASRAPGA